MGGKALKVLVVFHAEDKRIGIIGAGHLGSRVIEVLYERGHRKIAASRRNSFELEKISGQYLGIETFIDNAEAAQYSDIIVLAVKPAYVDDVAREITEYSSGKLVVSLAAAKSMTGSEIYENAAGPNSFTEKIYGIYREKGLVDVVNGCIGMTIEKCRQK